MEKKQSEDIWTLTRQIQVIINRNRIGCDSIQKALNVLEGLVKDDLRWALWNEYLVNCRRT